MFATSPRRFSRLLIASAASASLATVCASALAADTTEMLKTAEAACLESAASQGWRPDLAKVISSKALDADKVEVVFDLTKDGVNTARLTCPYSVKEGVGGAFAAPKAELAVPSEPVADAGTPVNQGKAWWLLLPLALALGSWLWLRGRDEPVGHAYATTGGTTGTLYGAEAAARDGLLEVREHPDLNSRVLRQIRSGDNFQITGVRRRDGANIEWLEVSTGGWVRDAETRYDRNIVRLT
ncbi:MAG: SH3 domain-containing protein [Cyanobacteriota bacterium]|nr:SH3 domain-containing protein [Cyanobacteriota bacterium]